MQGAQPPFALADETIPEACVAAYLNLHRVYFAGMSNDAFPTQRAK
jgi:hypothetical protein